MRYKNVFTGLVILMLITSQGLSQYLATESFDYPEGASMDAGLGEAVDGWAGPWELFDGNEGVMAVSDSGVVYTDLVDPPPHTGRQVSGANPAAWGWQRYGRSLSERWPNEAGTDYWLSFLIHLDEFTDNGWAGIGLYDSTAEKQLFGHEWGNEFYSLGLYNEEGLTDYSCHDGTVWLVVRVIMSGDTLPSRAFMWVNQDPAGEEPDTLLADARGNMSSLNQGFDRVVVHFGGEGVGMRMSVDEIRLGTSWQDVSSEIPTHVSERIPGAPGRFTLLRNYPNPFNPSTRIAYSLPRNMEASLIVYDLNGREIAVLSDGIQPAGEHSVTFDGAGLSSGVYVTVLQTAEFTQSRKILLTK